MNKRLLLIVLLYSAIFTINAQSKMNFSLAKKVYENTTDVNLPVPMLIQGEVELIKYLVTDVGGTFKFATANIASVTLSLNQLSTIIKNKAIQKVEAFPIGMKPLNDSTLTNANVIPVHNGQAPLSQAYDGSGVIVGIIDTGIDITHGDFLDGLGKTRILWLWDQNLGNAVNTPLPYNYGQEWSKSDIDNNINNPAAHTDPSSHGTHVAGVAVGNGLATGKFKAVAPESDIIFVALDLNNAPMVDAVEYIYNKAQLEGKPCVINVSLGIDYGLHDGRDIESQAIKSLINQNTGQAFVAAAGNSGNKGKCHLAYTVSPSTPNFTLFPQVAGNVYLNIVADTSEMKDVEFAIGADNMAPYSYRGSTAFTKVSAMPIQTIINTPLLNGGNQIGTIQAYLDTINGDYDLQFFITPDSTTYNWRLSAKGTGSFDLWNYDAATGSYTPIVSTGLPSSTIMTDSVNYKYPDDLKSIQGGFQCLDEVISVANYQNRRSYTDCNNNPYSDPSKIVGQLVVSSSKGPTRDGRVKPDIAASGDMTMAALSKDASAGPTQKAEGCKHVRNGGTSHAAPIVAGIAALYLQKNPTATAADVREAIIRCPIQDQFTGTSLPDNLWGYGKVNAFGTLTEGLTISQPRDTAICEGADATFTTTSSGTNLSYQWIVNNNGTFTNLTNTAPYSGVTTNTLTITAASSTLNGNKYHCIVSNIYSCDITSNAGTLTVNPSPTIINADTTTRVCFNASLQSTTLAYSGTTNTPTLYSINWNASALTAGFVNITDNILPVSPITISVPAGATSAVYTGTISVKNAGTCVSTAANTFSVTINSSPTLTATSGNKTTICTSDTYTVSSASTNGSSILWTHDGTGSLTGASTISPTYTANIADVNNQVILTMTVDETNGCGTSTATAYDTLIVNTVPIVTATAGNKTTICTSDTYTVSTASTNGSSIAWTHNGTGSITGASTISPSYTPVIADTNNLVVLTMTVDETNNCGTSSATAYDTLDVKSNPTVTFSGLTTSYCYDADPITLTGNPLGGLFTGTGITNSATGIFDPVISGNGTHIITYTYVDNNNCIDSASQTTTVFSQLVSQDSCNVSTAFYFNQDNANNVFTPNNDGINDLFELNYTGTTSSDFTLNIFDRWGNEIFITKSPKQKWDGRTTAGMMVTAGTYFYILTNNGINYKGYFTITM